MHRLGVSRDPLKIGAGWLAEKLGRLKLNGRLFDYSPLSRVVEMEALIAGTMARLSLWRTLAAAAEPRLDDIDFVLLVERAGEQLTGLIRHHGGAIDAMLATR
jgi:hypothetical protein